MWGDGWLVEALFLARRRFHQISELIPTWVRHCGTLPVPCILAHHAPVLLRAVVAIAAVFGGPCHCARGSTQVMGGKPSEVLLQYDPRADTLNASFEGEGCIFTREACGPRTS